VYKKAHMICVTKETLCPGFVLNKRFVNNRSLENNEFLYSYSVPTLC